MILRTYDTASSRNGFGQDDFLHVEDKRTRPAEPAATLGAPAAPTPFAA